METVHVVISDTSVLINLAHTGHLRLLGRLPGYRFLVAEEVLAELLDAAQIAAVEGAIGAGALEVTTIESMDELADFVDLQRVLGTGESACLALAARRGWMVACDERRTYLREAWARRGEGRTITTAEIYVLWIRGGVLGVAEADAAKGLLEGRRFRMKFGSFGELV